MSIFNKYLSTGIVVLFIILITSVYTLYKLNSRLKDELSIAVANEKALMMEASRSENHNGMLQLTINQLEYSMDSIIVRMNDLRKELKIKDKNLEQLGYISESLGRVDSIVFRDTIFSRPNINIDTIIGDKWYNININLKYPGSITIKPEFYNELFLIIDYKKETLRPPKKFFLFRWFQRRHKVIRAEIVKTNPYAKIKQRKFIKIVK